MVNIGTRIKIGKIPFDELKKRITEALGKQARKNVSILRPAIQNSIDNEIFNNRDNFIPTDLEAIELGIGSNGRIETDKTEGAWEALQTKSGEGVTIFEARTVGSSAQRIFMNITVDINRELFYSRPRSIVFTPDSDEIPVIPWMQWFIEGKSIGAVRFSNKQPIPNTSRTGGGIMIKQGFWDFQPRTIMLIEQLLERIRLRINRFFRTNGSIVLRN